MSDTLSEEEMRRALFGQSVRPGDASRNTASERASPPSSAKKGRVSRLRVTLHVSKDFEGAQEVFIHDANTLSTLIAETEAKAAAKKKKLRYIDVVSIKPVQV